MFGSKKIQELEARVSELQEKLNQQTAENGDLTQRLQSAASRIADLEAQLNDFDLEKLKEEAKTSRAEYEGLRELYVRKNREFDDFREGEEEQFARDQALKRHNLENEIRDNRQANQEYVASTVKTFGESYNYYLGQIKTLMDALSSVATRTGEALFSGENADLKSRFGSQMRDMLKAGAEGSDTDPDDLIFVGGLEEADEAPKPVEEIAEEAEEAVEEIAEAEEVVEEAVEETVEEAVEEAVKQAEEL